MCGVRILIITKWVKHIKHCFHSVHPGFVLFHYAATATATAKVSCGYLAEKKKHSW